jgi:hypothetical protein
VKLVQTSAGLEINVIIIIIIIIIITGAKWLKSTTETH